MHILVPCFIMVVLLKCEWLEILGRRVLHGLGKKEVGMLIANRASTSNTAMSTPSLNNVAPSDH